ncbi:maleylpyruvate isomerase family mycothiol-dependent enzyme [Streptomonospora wellingtoniae]|uniref:Maleylpyruvate isomerase family mycothiol-dependent enzyme n=1 Tax=Streptomonospora wellingtoniae TaxID=3075544 RepID=A0ABU2KRA8_9ACTN|nr:maleylpyruvate isomerase family mycothiol-dependent enzyme [Streptomonospora sp. DSM 45055]MDT0301800.1 maleylpyruvate isomerase family mycothiol-dependent enzyme [Streptomonospora sp. DSM 45055]
MLTTERLAEALADQTEGVVALAHGAELERQVPTCPDWDLRELLRHIGRAHRFSADTVRRRVSHPGELASPNDFPAPDEAGALAEWLRTGARELRVAVEDTGADVPVWNFSGRRRETGFWLRRMVHETSVHRADVAMTVGAPYEVAPDVAADGISEWLDLVTGPGAAEARPEAAEALRGQGQTLHLHATDPRGLGPAGEWLIRREPDGVTWHHGHQKADTALRGPAADLLLAFLGRIPRTDERIEVLGDTALLDHWLRHATF